MGGIYLAGQLKGQAVTNLCHPWRSAVQGGGAPTWSVAILWVCWSWGFPGGASQGQSPTVLSRAILPELSKKVVLVLGVEIASRT